MAATARLFINGTDVGRVILKSLADSWGFGEFTPNDAFEQYAAIFGNWSLLMHAEDDAQTLSGAASEELRAAEYAIDALRARLFVPDRDEWVELSQLNIDGNLIDWKIDGRHSGAPKNL